MNARSVTLDQVRAGTPYAAYSYSYPHKTAYRPLDPLRPLREVWAAEEKSSLFFYLHVPFCEMRCGFCNLFTTANPNETRVANYLAALERQAHAVREAIGPVAFARAAIGGGTPTYLSASDLEFVLRLARDTFGLDPHRTPTSVETSPRTADSDKLQLLRGWGVSRISIGVQSLVERETAAAGRAQKTAWVDAAIGRIRAAKFPTLNLDLIYGLPGQTVDSWERSLVAALLYRPEELYVYPLYVRPLTGLDRRATHPDDELRLACYRRGRQVLAEAGYEQLSMRMFRARWAPDADRGPVYCCQDDGMLGLGCGARSYTDRLHYSSEYAVGAAGVADILAHYSGQSNAAFARADYGCDLDTDERKRRWVIKSLLRMPGLCTDAYRAKFRAELGRDFPELQLLLDEGWAERTVASMVRLTEAGLERSDAIGPIFYSPSMSRLTDEYELD